ncbi:hypothetical protein [Streptomyces roseolilacinus]|uniref:hypothetical protein n=1 Tax=Streptomyces roseolilacinus TaxID=66904 RepID=UPI003823668B
MRQGRAPHVRETAAGISAIEGYLMAQATMRRAREQAEAFAGRMLWLTTGQREEVVRQYAADHLEQSKETLQAIVRRAAELREEYTARYEELRQRLLRIVVVSLSLAAALVAGLAAFALLGR